MASGLINEATESVATPRRCISQLPEDAEAKDRDGIYDFRKHSQLAESKLSL